MHTFAIAHVPRGAHIPPHVDRLLRDGQPADLTFVASDHVHWANRDGTTRFAGWSAGGDHLGRGGYHDIRPSGLTAFAGYLWVDARPWERWVPWASQLADHLESTPGAPAAGVGNLVGRSSGCFAVVRLDTDGEGAVGADALGLHMLYTATVGDLTVISNRAALAARLVSPAGRAPDRDVESAAWMAYAGVIMDDRSPFSDVRLLPVGSTVSLSPSRRPEIRSGDQTPWLDPSARLDPLDPASYEAAVADLRSNVRLIMSVQAWKHDLELTGGKDSRMILGLLLAEGFAHDVHHLTWGAPDLPDVVIANELADRFDLDLDASGRPPGRRSATSVPSAGQASGANDRPAADVAGERAPSDESAAHADPPADGPAPMSLPPDPPPLPDLPTGGFDALIRRHLWLTSGSQNIWDAYNRARLPEPHISITGLIGEVLRTNYPTSDQVRTREQLASFLDAGLLGHDTARLLRPDVSRHLRSRVDEHLDALFELTGDARDAIDGYYQIGRFRRWFGAGNELDNRNRMIPLYSLPAFRTAFAIGADQRRAERLPFQLMAATVPELATMPFAERNWSPRLVSTLPDPERYPTSPDPASPVLGPPRPSLRRFGLLRRRRTEPSRQTAPRTLVERRQDQSLESRIPLLRSYLDLGREHALYDFLDHDATMAAVRRLPELAQSGRKAVFAAVTAAMWLGGADLPLYPAGGAEE